MKPTPTLLLAALLATMTISAIADDLTLNLRSTSKEDGKTSEETVSWKPEKTALIICDMWDDHWCKSAARRVGEMAPALNETVNAAREKGVFIIHAPSSVG